MMTIGGLHAAGVEVGATIRVRTLDGHQALGRVLPMYVDGDSQVVHELHIDATQDLGGRVLIPTAAIREVRVVERGAKDDQLGCSEPACSCGGTEEHR